MSPDLRTDLEPAGAGRLAPGRLGLPVLGESFAYLRNPYEFLRSRHARYGPVFRTRFGGREIYCFSGPEALPAFYDRRNFTRVGANPGQVRQLLYPDAIVGLDHCPRHETRREFLLGAYSREMTDRYIPTIERVVARFVRRWERMGSFDWLPELKALMIAVLTALLGDPDSEGRVQPLMGPLDVIGYGALTPEIALPFTRFGKALAARDQIRAYVAARLADRNDCPGTVMEFARSARASQGGWLGDDEIEIELHHFLIGSFEGLTAAIAGSVLLLGDHPEVRTRAMREVADSWTSEDVSPGLLSELAFQQQIVDEVRRLRPLIAHSFFARSLRDFDVAGVRVPAGALGIASVYATLHDPSLFPNPDAFDPDRFGPERREGAREYTFVPHGAGPWNGHRCVGDGMTALILQVFLTTLLRGHEWEIQPHDRTLDMRMTVPLPSAGMPVRFGRV